VIAFLSKSPTVSGSMGSCTSARRRFPFKTTAARIHELQLATHLEKLERAYGILSADMRRDEIPSPGAIEDDFDVVVEGFGRLGK